MTRRSDRLIGDEFLPAERRLLDLLCAGTDPACACARTQLESASWGGYGFDDCECFMIRIGSDSSAPRIRHGGGPLVSADVEDDDGSIGMLELWVVDGLLHSVDFMPWGDDHTDMPGPDQYRITVVDAADSRG